MALLSVFKSKIDHDSKFDLRQFTKDLYSKVNPEEPTSHSVRH